MQRIVSAFAGLALLFSLCVLTGCSGGGGGAAAVGAPVGSTPETALQQNLTAWQQGGGPNLSLVAAPVPVGAVSSSGSYGTITFRDLSDGSWIFTISDIVYYSSDLAEIFTVFSTNYAATDTARINFTMAKEEGTWVIDEIEVSIPPGGIVTSGGTLQGVVTDALLGGSGSSSPVSGALVYIVGTSYQAVTDANGFYQINGIPAGTYDIVISRDGYAPKTFTRTIS